MDETLLPWSRAALEQAVALHGLRLLGGFVPGLEDQLPELPSSRQIDVVWMVGQVGTECWPHFTASPFFRDGLENPMDRWSRSIAESLAEPHGGEVLMPSEGPPWYPFQQWALRIGEGLQASPLQLHMHPRYGLWHAWRFALALPRITPTDAMRMRRPDAPAPSDICARCAGQPCLNTCPVDAFKPGRFDARQCMLHVQGPDGGACKGQGCRARGACPVGADWRYTDEQAAFHLVAFARDRH